MKTITTQEAFADKNKDFQERTGNHTKKPSMDTPTRLDGKSDMEPMPTGPRTERNMTPTSTVIKLGADQEDSNAQAQVRVSQLDSILVS